MHYISISNISFRELNNCPPLNKKKDLDGSNAPKSLDIEATYSENAKCVKQEYVKKEASELLTTTVTVSEEEEGNATVHYIQAPEILVWSDGQQKIEYLISNEPFDDLSSDKT